MLSEGVRSLSAHLSGAGLSVTSPKRKQLVTLLVRRNPLAWIMELSV